jgi:hypothetical protein
MLTTGLPTLSSIQAWDVEHLTEAADHWGSTADRWETVSAQVWQQSHGLDWEGQARDALVERTTTDKTTIISKADQLREAATIARRGAGDIDAAKRRVLYAVEDAHNAGFAVGEDLSVTDTRTRRNAAELAARQAQAQALSADIRARAAQLVAVDSEVGTNITGAAGDVGDTTFTETPVTYDGRQGKIQMAGHGFKQDPPPTPPPPQPAPGGGAIKRPPQTTMNTSPPIAMSPPSNDPSKHDCGPGEIFIDTTESVGGAAGIASGVAGEVPTAGGTSAIVIGGLSALLDGINKLSQCR